MKASLNAFLLKRISFSYCGDKVPNPVTLTGKAARKGLKVRFTSDNRKQGYGAQCIAMCLDGVTTTPAPTTNLGRDVLKIKKRHIQ